MEFEGEVSGEGMATMLSFAKAGGALGAALGTAPGAASGASPDAGGAALDGGSRDYIG